MAFIHGYNLPDRGQWGPIRKPSSCMETPTFAMLEAPPKPEDGEDGFFSSKNLREMLPKSIPPDEKGAVVMNRIADKGFQKFVASEGFKSTPLGSLNEKVQEKTKIEMSLKPEGQQIQHKLKAQVQPFQGEAILSYSGYIGVDVALQPANALQKVKLEEEIFKKKIYFENRQGPIERLQQVGIRWDW